MTNTMQVGLAALFLVGLSGCRCSQELDGGLSVAVGERKLLQENEDGAEEKEPKKRRNPVELGSPRLGPTLFYDGSDFLMRLGAPIKVHIFRGSERKEAATVVSLDAAAISVKGSMVDADQTNFKVNIDWKQKDFGDGIRISSIQINMRFVKHEKQFTLRQLDVVHLFIGGRQIVSIPLEVTTSTGYKIEAPLGTAFSCGSPGMFRPSKQQASNDFAVGLTFPDVTLQVFELKRGTRFGPEWGCGELISIGLWVGLIVTFFFALICFYGFSMLAGIHTMDRFDDPKGKCIHIPQTE